MELAKPPLRIMFGDLRYGRLKRGNYLAYPLLATALSAFALLCIVLAIGSVAGLLTGSNGGAGELSGDSLRGPGFLMLAFIGLASMFVHANLSAKRYRDMGLNGWQTLLVLSLLMVPAYLVLGPGIPGILQALVFLSLVLIPTNRFNPGKSD